MRTLKLTLAYDGTRFVGWQRQAEGLSIQGVLEAALARFEGGPVTVHGAGRTDAGVHALGQVASVQVSCLHDAATLARALNAQLPDDLRVLSIADAPPAFHARFSARSKTYRYLWRIGPVSNPFERAYVWHLTEPVDVDAMRRAAQALVGTHDFTAFRSAGSGTTGAVRTITRSEIRLAATPWTGRDGTAEPPEGTPCPATALIAYEVTGDGFLRHMVRAIAGTLAEIGRGWRLPESMAALVQTGSRAEAGATAPARGLFLVAVDYD